MATTHHAPAPSTASTPPASRSLRGTVTRLLGFEAAVIALGVLVTAV